MDFLHRLIKWVYGWDNWMLEHVHGIYLEPMWIRDGTQPGSKRGIRQ